MKIDPYKHEITYFNWKAKLKETISGLSKTNSQLIVQYILDMENGLNVSSTNKKGSRSFGRLNTLRHRITFLCSSFENLYNLEDVTNISEEQLFSFFTKMRNGEIKTNKGSLYKSVADYVKVFKAFWHWHQKINRKRGIEIRDITQDLDTSSEKPQWVYLDEQQLKKLCDNAKHEYKVLIMFLFDSGMRAPSELVNIKVSDFLDDFKTLNIRDEISKTFGRKIKLMLCSDLVKNYILDKKLNPSDYIFPICPPVVNRYLRRLGERIFGNGESLAGEKYSQLNMYDFRHISCCYWLPRYKSESALKYRFGWKNSDKIHYYSELLGMKDTITSDDLFVDASKTELEQKQDRLTRENELLRDKVENMEGQMNKILEMVKMMAVKYSEN